MLLRMQPPEDELQDWPSIAIARPSTRDVLQHGPFAFKLSPSSEVLAHLIVTRLRKALAGKHVLEVGAGLGYAGIACAAWTDAASVILTDGDPISVAALRRNVELNAEASAFGSTAVEARQLCYGGALYKEGDYRNARVFDCILCADCAQKSLSRWRTPAGLFLALCHSRACQQQALRDPRSILVGEW